jgi:hypothetical protein
MGSNPEYILKSFQLYIPKLFFETIWVRQFSVLFLAFYNLLDFLFSLQLIQASEPEFVCPPYV